MTTYRQILALVVLAFLSGCGTIPVNQSKPPCLVGDTSVDWYLSQSESDQQKIVDNYRVDFQGPQSASRAALSTLFPPPDYVTSDRLKNTASIRAKIKKKRAEGRPYNCFSKLGDVVGLRIIARDYSGFAGIYPIIHNRFQIASVEDKIDKSASARYRAIHYNLIVTGRKVELQVHTRRSALISDASHKMVYKGPYGKSDAVIAYLAKLGYAAYLLDLNNSATLPAVPTGLPKPAIECLSKLVMQLGAVKNNGAYKSSVECLLPKAAPNTNTFQPLLDLFDMVEYAIADGSSQSQPN